MAAEAAAGVVGAAEAEAAAAAGVAGAAEAAAGVAGAAEAEAEAAAWAAAAAAVYSRIKHVERLLIMLLLGIRPVVIQPHAGAACSTPGRHEAKQAGRWAHGWAAGSPQPQAHAACRWVKGQPAGGQAGPGKLGW